MSAEPVEARSERVHRVLRALRIRGRRLLRRNGEWGVLCGPDARHKLRLRLECEDVEGLLRNGKIVQLDENTCALCLVEGRQPLEVEPWALVAAGVWRSSRQRGVGFSLLIKQSRQGRGSLAARHIETGLRLIADAEQSVAFDGFAINEWLPPTGRRESQCSIGGLKERTGNAARRLRRARAMTDPVLWSIGWALCVEGQPFQTLRSRFGLGRCNAGETFAAAMEAITIAYER